MMASMEPPSHLIGPGAKLRVLDQLVDAAPTSGVALVLLGETGIGKSR
jgi:transcriptional regulator with AAA-type ATPase domain